MTAVSTNVYSSKLDETVDKYIKTYHRTMKMKPAHIQPGMCFEYIVGHNDKDPKFKVGDHVRISKYKNISQSFSQIFRYSSNLVSLSLLLHQVIVLLQN